MSNTTDNDRAQWVARWRDTVWERLESGHWSLLATTSSVPLVVVTAWNPGGRQLPDAINQARDLVLQMEIKALGCAPLRARGRSPDGMWREDGWQIPHSPARSLTLLHRYGQLAGWVTDADGARYLWRESWCPVPLAR
jgi:hypothetical protein